MPGADGRDERFVLFGVPEALIAGGLIARTHDCLVRQSVDHRLVLEKKFRATRPAK
jgi:hypothetical protein